MRCRGRLYNCNCNSNLQTRDSATVWAIGTSVLDNAGESIKIAKLEACEGLAPRDEVRAQKEQSKVEMR
jgi:hypothetical protein